MMKREIFERNLLRSVIAGTALLSAGAIAGDMTIYSLRDYKGEAMTVRGPAPSLERIGNGDTAASVVVRQGVWQLCTDTQFRGRCMEVQPGEYSSLGMGPDSRIASAREIAAGSITAVVPSSPAVATITVPVTPAPAIVATTPVSPVSEPLPQITLYERNGFRGPSIELSQSDRNLGRFGAARPESAIVTSGVWRLCESPRGRGDCIEVGPGRYENLGALDDRIGSAELIASNTVVPAVSEGRAVLYQYPNFRGHSLVVDGRDAPRLDAAFFDSGAASLRVESGNWVFCSGASYAGECRTFAPGEYAHLPWDVDRVASGHLAAQRYSSLR
jgi:hypothetical protein